MKVAWQGARRETLYLALAGMDVCFLLPIVLALGQFAVRFPPGRAALAFGVVTLLAFNLTRLLDALNLKERVQRDAALLFLLLWLLAALRFTLYRYCPLLSLRWIGEMVSHVGDRALWPQDVTIIVATLIFWWRGLRLASRPLEVGPIGFHFRAGVLVMAGAVALSSQLLEWSPTPFVFSYFFLSLIAIALARAEEVGRWREGLQFPFNIGWLLSIAAAAAGVILISIGLIALLTGETMLQALALLGPVWDTALLILAIIIFIAVAILYPLVQLLVGWLAGSLEEGALELRPELPAEQLFEFERQGLSSPHLLLEPYRPLLSGLAVLGGVLVAALFFGRLWRARRQLGKAHAEPVRGERGPGAGLADRALQQLRSLVGRLGPLDRWYAAASIRRIYAQMAALTSRRGYPRASPDTPYEYLPALAEVWPGSERHTKAITEAYVKTHYGEVPESPDELRALRAALDQLRQQ